MSSTYRSSRTALNIVSRTSRTRSQGPAPRKYPPASRRQTSTVVEAEAATATARQTSHPSPGACNAPEQEPWKGKEATGLQDTLRHAYERELGRPQLLIYIYDLVRGGLRRVAIRDLHVLMVPNGLISRHASLTALDSGIRHWRNLVLAC